MHPEALRPLFDEHGLLKAGALESPEPVQSFVCFARREDAPSDPDAWAKHGDRFFRARVGVTADKRYAIAGTPMVDAVGVVLAPAEPFRDAGGPAVRLLFARPAEPTDHD